MPQSPSGHLNAECFSSSDRRSGRKDFAFEKSQIEAGVVSSLVLELGTGLQQADLLSEAPGGSFASI